MRAFVLVTLLLTACQTIGPPLDIPPESDAGVPLEPERNVVLPIDGKLVQVTNLPGAEELEVVSPDGTWVAFVSGTTGLAAIWAQPLPTDVAPEPTPIQVTNVGLERTRRIQGQPPVGFVPVPDRANGLRWLDDRTLAWTARGADYTAAVSR